MYRDVFRSNTDFDDEIYCKFKEVDTSYNHLAIPAHQHRNYVIKAFKKRKSHDTNMGWLNKMSEVGIRHVEKPVEPTKVKFWWIIPLMSSLN